MTDCNEWLRGYLRGKDLVLCEEVRDEAQKQGYKKKELKEARKNIGVETVNNWAWNDGETSEWFWRLPE